MPAPVITNAYTAGGNVGTPFSLQITATNSPTSYDAYERFDELPPGLSINKTTGLISGTPTAPVAQDTWIQVFATNASGTGKLQIGFHIRAANVPIITSGLQKFMNYGVADSYQIATTNSPTSYSYFAESGALPPGMTFNFATGLLSGTPALQGFYLLKMFAFSTFGFDSTWVGIVVTNAASLIPVISTYPYIVADKGQVVSLKLVATNSPTLYSVRDPSKLPPGLTLNSTTGILQGVPTVSGMFHGIVFLVNNSHGQSGGQAVIQVDAAIDGTSPAIQRGLYELTPPGANIPGGILDNAYVDGVSLQMAWKDIETAPFVYDFATYFTPRIDAIIAAGKKVLLRILDGGGAAAQGGDMPDHVATAMGYAPASHTIVPGTNYTYNLGASVYTVAVPWHPTFFGYRRALNRAFYKYLKSLTTTQRAAVQIVAGPIASMKPGSGEWYFPHGTNIEGTGGPTGTGYTLNERDRWLNATGAGNPGAGYTSAKMDSIAAFTGAPTAFTGIMTTSRTLFDPEGDFTAFDKDSVITGGGIPPLTTVASVVNAQTLLIDQDATVIGMSINYSLPERANGLIPTLLGDGSIPFLVSTDAGAMGTELDVVASGGNDTTNYLIKSFLLLVNNASYVLQKIVTNLIPKEPVSVGTEWWPIHLLRVNFIPSGGRNLYKVWGDTTETGGSGFLMNGGTADDPDGIVPNPPGMNAVLIFRRSAEKLSTYASSFLEVWPEDLVSQAESDLQYVRSLLNGGSVFNPSAPTITSPLTLEGRSNETATYQITANGLPNSFEFTPDMSAGYNLTAFNPSSGLASLDLLAPGNYSITIKATNAYGTDTKTLLLTVDVGVVDLIPPTAPTLLHSTFIDDTSVAMAWEPSTDFTGVEGYNIIRNGVQIGTVPTPSFTDTFLNPHTQYTYQVTAFDAAGNVSAGSNIITVTTLVGGMTSPPTVPTNLRASRIGDLSVDLVWDASTDETAVTGYQIFRDGIEVGTSPDASFTDSRLNPSTVYVYTVTAYNAAGAISAASLPLSIKTLSLGAGAIEPSDNIPRLPAPSTVTSNIKLACKLRYVAKRPGDLMTIRNLEAIRLECDAILREQAGEWPLAAAASARATEILQMELREHLNGIQPTVPFGGGTGMGLGELGGVL